MKRAFLLLFTLIIAFFSWSGLAQAITIDFNTGLIIRSEQLLAVNAMSATEIQQFLDEHRGVLKTYFSKDLTGQTKSAAEIISSAASRNGINPQYILVLLQKEQGLITDTNPKQTQLDWATGYAVCDSCSVTHPGVLQYKGFAKQIDSAAWRTRYFFDNPTEFNFESGGTYTIDGVVVQIQDPATATLYNYTPHINGNRIFSKLWNAWFDDFVYPDGSLLQIVGQPGVWLIKNDIRHAFTNKTSLTSRYPLEQILQVSVEVAEGYPKGDPISFAEFSLVQTPGGEIYLLADLQRRLIIDQQTFRLLGFTIDEVVPVTNEEIAFFAAGSPITPQSLAPIGSLLQNPETFGIFFVKDGVKYPLIAPELLSLNYPQLRARKASLDELNRYEKGSPALLNDGVLVKTADNPTVYVTANGILHPIDSEFTFITLGYEWEKIHLITGNLRDIHTIGEVVSVLPQLSDQEAEELISELEL